MSAATLPLEYLLQCRQMFQGHHYQKPPPPSKRTRAPRTPPAKKNKRARPHQQEKEFAFELDQWPLRLSGLRVPSLVSDNELVWVTVLAQTVEGQEGVLRVVLYDITHEKDAYEGLEDPYFTYANPTHDRLHPGRLYTKAPNPSSEYEEVLLFDPDGSPVTDLYQRLVANRI